MSHHWATALILLTAVILALVGISTGASVLIGVGVAFELWFWVRLLRARPTHAPTPAR